MKVGRLIETVGIVLVLSPFFAMVAAVAGEADPAPVTIEAPAPSTTLPEATTTTAAPIIPTTTTEAPVPLPMPAWGEPELVPATAGQEPLQPIEEVMGREPLAPAVEGAGQCSCSC